MKEKHIFVSLLDVNETLPFATAKKKKVQKSLEEQDRAKKELITFINTLEKKFSEPLSYIGMDVIGEKSYERFMFKGSGFFEVMVENPVAMTAHFPDRKRAVKFCKALKATLKHILPKNPETGMMIESLEVQDEKDKSLNVEDWHKIKGIRA